MVTWYLASRHPVLAAPTVPGRLRDSVPRPSSPPPSARCTLMLPNDIITMNKEGVFP
jgi:hypothetical protein